MNSASIKIYSARVLLVALTCFALAKCGARLTFASPECVIPVFWPAAGFGLAMAVLFGWRIGPGIFIGALVFNLSDLRPPGLAVELAVISTLQALVPAGLLGKTGFRPALNRWQDCVVFWVAINLGALISATLGGLAWAGLGRITLSGFCHSWLIAFLAEILGGMIVGGMILSWSRLVRSEWDWRRALELMGLFLLTVVIVQLIFFQPHDTDTLMPFWMFPVFVWAALRFGPPGSTFISAIFGGLAAWDILHGGGYFQDRAAAGNILALQAFIGIAATTGLLLAAVADTARRVEQNLRESQANMAAAQRLASFGSWELDLTNASSGNGSPLRWSDECYGIFGFDPHTTTITNDLFFSRIHPDDREAVARSVARAIKERAEYSLVHRILLSNGETHYIHALAKVLLTEETKAPHKLIGTMHDITERQRAEAQLRESEERYRLLADNATDMITRHNTLGVFLYVSPACRTLLQHEPEDFLGREAASFYHPEDVATVREATRLLLEDQETHHITYRFRRRDGSFVWVETTARGLVDPNNGKINEIICISRDITERRALESQLQHVQKMEAIGQLAGGVAHDFNNLLTVITGYVGLIQAELPAQHSLRESVGEISKAANRATALTRQLLGMARRAILDPKVTNLNTLVRDSEKIIQRMIGEDIEFTTALAASLNSVKVDRSQIEQVMLNLILNARDAMPGGGKLTIETANVFLDEEYTRLQAEARPGPHVLLAISDTGQGMSPETLERIFEPFFTTKGLGKGTGLGLATAYGIIKQSGGHINVYSKPGFGTSFKIYLPAVSEIATEEKKPAADRQQLVPGRGTILLVEDEEAVRIYAERTLFEAGYRVITAANGEEAVEIAAQLLDQIDGLVTDVVMPRMGGRQLAENLRAKKPGLKILFMSGYTDDAVLRHGVLTSESAFLQKPFTAVDLSRKLREVMTA